MERLLKEVIHLSLKEGNLANLKKEIREVVLRELSTEEVLEEITNQIIQVLPEDRKAKFNIEHVINVMVKEARNRGEAIIYMDDIMQDLRRRDVPFKRLPLKSQIISMGYTVRIAGSKRKNAIDLNYEKPKFESISDDIDFPV